MLQLVAVETVNEEQLKPAWQINRRRGLLGLLEINGTHSEEHSEEDSPTGSVVPRHRLRCQYTMVTTKTP
jgi:hypothetical protein